MELHTWMERFWRAVAQQDAKGLEEFFHPEATICWHATDEQFTLPEYIRANCEYPGRWSGELERLEVLGDLVITATRVWTQEYSFHVVSFFTLREGKISRLEEYWGDDGPAPQWRQDLGLGRPIQTN